MNIYSLFFGLSFTSLAPSFYSQKALGCESSNKYLLYGKLRVYNAWNQFFSADVDL